jgi:hypothetical protein
MRNHGFIKADDITALDFQLSFTKNKDEEKFVISQEKNDEIDLNDNKFEKYNNHCDEHEE